MRSLGWSTDSRRAAGRALAAALGLALFAGLITDASAQSALDALRQRDRELEELRTQQKTAAETEAKLKIEIDAIGEDRRKLNQALIDTAARLRATEVRIADTEGRLKPLDATEQAIRQSLANRRATIAEVLGALQRIGRLPPPAIMVSPEDALQSVRTAILLGAVVPDMRGKAEALAADLQELARVRKDIAQERVQLERDVAALAEERQRIAALIDERQKKQADAERALDAERQRALVLGPAGRQSQRFDRPCRTGARQCKPGGALRGARHGRRKRPG